jgi:hypothetical protein
MAKSNIKGAPTGAEVQSITQALAAPFDPTEVRWKPQTVSGNRALVVAFVDARVIQDRLDDVVGPQNWEDAYHCLPDGAVVCRLRVRLGEEWITKHDVGGQSEQPDEGDRRKAAFSDALKRAAVKFGIGRYLYRLKPQWVDYDPQKKQIVGTPRLPATLATPPAEKPTQAKPAKPKPEEKPQEKKPEAARKMPENGEELHRRLTEKDRALADKGVCKPGELVKSVVEAGVKKGFEKDLSAWSGEAIRLAIEEVRAFEARRSAPAQAA